MIRAGTGIVLAGGRSSRLGTEKALALLGDRTLIERVLDVLVGMFPVNFVVTKDVRRYRFLERGGVKVIADRFREQHALGGICTGLERARTRHSFVTSCDQPYLQPKLIRALWSERRGHDAVVPYFGGRVQSLCAVYSRSCVKPMTRMIGKRRLRIRDLFWIVRTVIPIEAVKRADPRGLSFMDVDTPADLRRLRRYLGRLT